MATSSIGSLLAALVLGAIIAASGSAAGATKTRQLTLYSTATAEQFINNKDDETKAEGNNPFGNFTDATALAQRSGNGPFAGDEAVFQLTLYTTPDLRKQTGTAFFFCQYGFQKHGFCNASFRLRDGTIVGAGDFSFDAPSFDLAITGGTGAYHGARGTLKEAAAAASHAQRLAFEFS